jgi:hypothetical protein
VPKEDFPKIPITSAQVCTIKLIKLSPAAINIRKNSSAFGFTHTLKNPEIPVEASRVA